MHTKGHVFGFNDFNNLEISKINSGLICVLRWLK